jgi:hypothetical protein
MAAVPPPLGHARQEPPPGYGSSDATRFRVGPARRYASHCGVPTDAGRATDGAPGFKGIRGAVDGFAAVVA